jgi:hypothetical protein
MAKRILLAGVLGGLAMFVWLSLAHVVLGIGSVGIKEFPDEQAMLGAMRTSLPQSGFYIFPGMGQPSGATRAQQSAAMQAYQQKIQNGPSGMLIYHPNGQKALSPGQLITEFTTNIIQGLLAAFLLSLATGLRSYAARVGFVTLAGIVAGITTNISYWNWYGFPASYTASYALTEIVGFLCIGLVAGAIIKHGSTAPMSAKAAA